MATETRTLKFNCTTCPSECALTVEVEVDTQSGKQQVISVCGNHCPRGDAFARQELTRPMRVLATTVAVSGGDERLLPVRTHEAIPRDLHSQAMTLLRGVVIHAPIRMGDVVVPNILDTGIDVVASMDVSVL